MTKIQERNRFDRVIRSIFVQRRQRRRSICYTTILNTFQYIFGTNTGHATFAPPFIIGRTHWFSGWKYLKLSYPHVGKYKASCG